MPKKEISESYNKYFFEIRYKSNPKVLDLRGSWAEKVSEYMELPHWRIEENRIDIYDKDSKNRVFIGFKNSGFVSSDVPTSNYFPDKSIKFFKFVLELDGFNAPIIVNRIGLRLQSYSAFKGTFEELLRRYSSKFLNMNENAKKIFDAKLVDIGGPLSFVNKHGNFYTMSGPMNDVQASQLLNRKDKLPKVGLYFDIDYWQKPNKKIGNVKILKQIHAYSKETWDKYEKIRDLLLKD